MHAVVIKIITTNRYKEKMNTFISKQTWQNFIKNLMKHINLTQT